MAVEIVRVSGDAAATVGLFWTMLAAFLGALVACGGALVVVKMWPR
jgi:hypothetical protein